MLFFLCKTNHRQEVRVTHTLSQVQAILPRQSRSMKRASQLFNTNESHYTVVTDKIKQDSRCTDRNYSRKKYLKGKGH